ncbi:MAG: RagB/SusD family nutrient uptake outer membrane protein, partial [Flavobacterium psychrophilum]
MKYRNLLFIIPILFSSACKKDWLNAKPEKRLAVPSTIKDYQALLDKTDNQSGAPFNVNESILDEHGANDFYVTDNDYSSRSPTERNYYTWAANIYANSDYSGEWTTPYERIYYSNVVLEGIEKVKPLNTNEQQQWNQVKGSALFLRAYNHYQIAKLYCKQYEQTTAKTDLGIPLRLTADFNIKSHRSSVEQTYNQIVEDLRNSIALLPVQRPENDIYKLRPNLAAANAFLARIYLFMGNYDSALTAADRSLALYSNLIDFNSLTVTATNFPIQALNAEVLFHSTGTNWTMHSISRVIVDSNLFKLYNTNDLRRTVFIKTRTGALRFYGNYNGTKGTWFTGLATDEVFLIRAECYARKGNTSSALADLNHLLQKRWNKNSVFQPITAADPTIALTKVLEERRKELCFRG